MKPYFLFAFAVLMAFTACDKPSDSGANTFEYLKRNFEQPPKEFGTVPLYVWNTKITRGLIDSTMIDLKNKGFGGVFVHPRPGLITEYASDEWYDLFRHALDKGKELDMNVWIYDENSYPSGFAGGHVPAQMPESYNQGHALNMIRMEAFPDKDTTFFIVLKDENGTFTDITAQQQSEKGKKGNYCIFEKTYPSVSDWYGGFSYVDLLYKGVTEKFIEVTMTGYKKVAGDEFGKSMPGWFTDEPNIHSYGATRWTPDLFDVFKQKWGYDLKLKLPLLYEEKDNWEEVRHNYVQTLLQLFIDRWAKPCFEYCEANNLKFTGHYWEHGWPDMGHGGDNMAMYAWHQMPGIDMLFNQFNEVSPQAQFGNIRAVKELSSAANQMGWNRTFSETYGGGGWEETFNDFKRLGDWEYALGVNFMNQHLTHLSISGARKYDYPPTFSEHSPWWPYYRELNMHYARLSMALSAGEQINDILLLEPTTSAWLYYSYGKSSDKIWTVGNSFQKFVTDMEKAQSEYDLGSENIIKDHGSVNKNKFVIKKRSYSKVIIPQYTENLDKATFDLLKKFVENGGKLYSFSIPDRIDGKINNEVKEYFTNNKSIIHYKEITADLIKKEFNSKEFAFEKLSGGNLFHHRRNMKDGYVVFLSNAGTDQTSVGTISVDGKDAVEFNTMTGKIADYPETVNGNKINVDFSLPPSGSLLLYVSNKKFKDVEPYVGTENYVAVNPVSDIVAKPDDLNCLTIDFCDLQIGKEHDKDLHIYSAADKAFKLNGFKNGNPWNTSVQYKNNIISRDTFSTGGFKVTYKFFVRGDFDMSDMKAAIERPWLYKVSLNGKEIKPGDNWWLDRDAKIFEIGNLVVKGQNSISIELSPMKIHAEIEPIYILGNFTVSPASKGWEITAPNSTFATGSWKKQGWPFYSKSVTYNRDFDLQSIDGNNYIVKLGEWQGTVAEVTVNGKVAGLAATEPYVVNVTNLVKQGKNTVTVKVVGSNKNLLGPFHNNHNPGLVSPWHFRNIKEYPAGNKYQQLDYGIEDFMLEVSNK